MDNKEIGIKRIDDTKIISTRNLVPSGKRANLKDAVKKIRGNDKPSKDK